MKAKIFKQMTRTNKTILLFILIIFVGILIPHIFCMQEKLKWSLDIIRTIATVAASILAFFYFDPFGIRKTSIAKQHENVIQILEKTFLQRIFVETKSNCSNSIPEFYSMHSMTTKHLKEIFNDDLAKEYLNYPILLNPQNFIEKTKDLTELKNSIYTPTSISKKMEFLEFYVISKSEKKHENFSIVTWGEEKKIQGLFFDKINNKTVTLKELFTNYQNLIHECITWLEKNSFSTVQLNIK